MNNVRELIRRYKPGESIRHIEIQGGLPENKLGYYLKPGSHVRRMPTPETIRDIAQALGCPDRVVFRAFAKDLSYPI